MSANPQAINSSPSSYGFYSPPSRHTDGAESKLYRIHVINSPMLELSKVKHDHADFSSPLFLEALSILASGECHPGAVCRTAFALSRTYLLLGDSPSAHKYLASAHSYRARILDADIRDLDDNPSNYDRFVTIGLR